MDACGRPSYILLSNYARCTAVILLASSIVSVSVTLPDAITAAAAANDAVALTLINLALQLNSSIHVIRSVSIAIAQIG